MITDSAAIRAGNLWAHELNVVWRGQFCKGGTADLFDGGKEHFLYILNEYILLKFLA